MSLQSKEFKLVIQYANWINSSPKAEYQKGFSRWLRAVMQWFSSHVNCTVDR